MNILQKITANLKLRGKLLFLVLPLVISPLFIVAAITGFIANNQAYLGITKTSKADLEHSASFTIDLLNSHYQQFQVYRQDKIKNIQTELAAITNLAYNIVTAEESQLADGNITKDRAFSAAKEALKKVNIAGTGYIYAMRSDGKLVAHIAREGENVYNEKDENGRYFIKEMCETAKKSKDGEMLFITYPWKNEILGDKTARKKIVAYRYFKKWDWIIATGGYLDETADDAEFEKKAFASLKERIKAKKIGATGYIYCIDSRGNFKIHPDSEGKNFIDAKDSDGFPFIKEMCQNKNGWIRYPWKNSSESLPRMKIARYEYFKPYDWIVAVGSYEDEFYEEANSIKAKIASTAFVLAALVAAIATIFVFKASEIFTEPISRMMNVIRRVKRGDLEEKIELNGSDELAEMGSAFNKMIEIIKHNKEIEATLAQQGKMASLGVLSSGVAHEINNPLGVILGYAAYIEGKMNENDPNYKYVHEIKRESKRCKKIVQDLLNYARTPRPTLEEIDINKLLNEIIDFAANHTDMKGVKISKELSFELPKILADGDQIRQVTINLILNAGGAMKDGGELTVKSSLFEENRIKIEFIDNGSGISDENLEKIFEPFFTTKERGTGLGLPITKQIVEQHHGEIKIESKIGRGSIVTVVLPLNGSEL